MLGLAPVTFPQPILTAAMRNSLMPVDTSNNGLRKSFSNKPAITNSEDNLFKVYPNPTIGNIMATSTLDGVFSLHTIDGRTVSEFIINKGTTSVQISEILPRGLYIGVFKPNNGNKESILRLVVQP